MKKLTARDNKALSLMNDGAKFRRRLERTYMGEKLTTRLVGKGGIGIAGFGFQTWNALLGRGLIARDRDTLYGSACVEEFRITDLGRSHVTFLAAIEEMKNAPGLDAVAL